MNLQTYLEPKVDLERLRAMFDTCGNWARINAVRSLTPAQLKVLYDASEGAEALTLDSMVPTGEALTEVIHYGKNGLPAFNHFQKRFCRPDGDDSPDQLWGYNENPGFQMAVTGPGYYVATVNEKGEIVVDYTRVPPRKPASWPPIMGPRERLGFLIWDGMKDHIRKVSEHVSIGMAYLHGKPRNQYFALCREQPKD